MNNGKVRIYDLSKDLNLENKDILDICEQLNISVKSHSSTISESESERIRAAAEKYTPSPVTAKSHGSHTSPEGNPSASPSLAERDKRAHKQQILAVHKPDRPRPNPNPNGKGISQGLSSQGGSNMLTPPPPRPVKPQISHPVRPTATSDNETVELVELSQDGEESPTVAAEPRKHRNPIKDSAGVKVEARQLVGPPTRQNKENVEFKSENRPILKLDKKPDGTGSESVSPPVRSGIAPRLSSESAPRPRTDGQKVQPKVGRPQRPKSPQESKVDVSGLVSKSDVDQDDNEDGSDLDLETTLLEPPKRPQLKLKRPTPPRMAKRPVWEDEEEEPQDEATKAKAAAAAKTKRRSQIVIEDDDEDIASQLQNIALPTAVTLSVARPAKPKSDEVKSTPAPNTSRVKRPSPKGEGGASKSESRERRRGDRKVVVELPESIVLPESLTVRELAERLNTSETEIIKKLFSKRIQATITQTLDYQTACLVLEEFGVAIEQEDKIAAATKSTEMVEASDFESLQRRPPVVTIMGHVDHGKTTLLDSIRKTKVAQGEAGGITQHIGAYHVDIEHAGKTQQIVFLDTPGHEAFTAMRARGARVTDIAILVVAADDGVQPQTREAISHAKAAGVPIVIAINKVDKVGAEPDRVKQELTEYGLVPEEWGGDTIMVPVSALKGENLDTLLEMIILVSEVEELSANPDRLARGTVIEANLDRTKGPVATLLIQNGTLRVGDVIVAGSVFGKIRAMIDDRGDKVDAASPSFAVEVLGLSDVPAAGDEFEVFENEKEARALAGNRSDDQRQYRLQNSLSSRRVTLSTLSEKVREGELKELNLILKADVQGSVEAILGSLKQLPQNEVQIRILLGAPGEVTETDVDLAAASGAVIVGFNTTLATGARAAADREGVDIREYNIIYKLLDEIQGAMEGLLDPEEIEESLGQAEVRVVFSIGRSAVAGCYVQSGKIVRNRFMRVRRGNEIVYTGVIDSLKRVKEDSREVAAGYECGIGSSRFSDWREGDIIEAYQMSLKRRTLSVN